MSWIIGKANVPASFLQTAVPAIDPVLFTCDTTIWSVFSLSDPTRPEIVTDGVQMLNILTLVANSTVIVLASQGYGDDCRIEAITNCICLTVSGLSYAITPWSRVNVVVFSVCATEVFWHGRVCGTNASTLPKENAWLEPAREIVASSLG